MGFIWNTSKTTSQSIYDASQRPDSRSNWHIVWTTVVALFMVGFVVGAVVNIFDGQPPQNVVFYAIFSGFLVAILLMIPVAFARAIIRIVRDNRSGFRNDERW